MNGISRPAIDRGSDALCELHGDEVRQLRRLRYANPPYALRIGDKFGFERTAIPPIALLTRSFFILGQLFGLPIDHFPRDQLILKMRVTVHKATPLLFPMLGWLAWRLQ